MVMVGAEVRVYDLEGRCLYQGEMRDEKCIIDSSALDAGVYVVKCGSASCKVIVK